LSHETFDVSGAICPTRGDSVNVALLACGGQARVISLKAWNMHPAQ
jgi:hypothetical protein